LKHVYSKWDFVSFANVIVAQPAIPVNEIEPCDTPPSRRDFDIIVWDRFDASKLMGADIVIPKLSQKYRVVIIGGAGKEILPILYTLGAEVVITNADWATIRKYICSSRVMVSFKVDEHFGIATAEAVSIGVLPVVHASGGKWTDICVEGKYCWGFLTVTDAFTTITRVVDDARRGDLDNEYYARLRGARSNLLMMQDNAFNTLMSKIASLRKVFKESVALS
jgi:hypothetical protein